MKTLFLTGAAEGIGREVARLFYSKGYNVAFMDINEEQSRETVEGWDVARYRTFTGDVRSKADIKQAVDATIATFGHIDTLVLNAGIHRSNSILSIEESELDMMIDINVRGYINTIRDVLPHMVEAGGGSIVANVSDQAFISKGNSFGYALTKGAVASMVRSVAVDYGKHGITISGVCAGTIDTPLARRALQRWADRDLEGNLDKAIELEATDFPVGRIGQPEEVAAMFYFLANAPFVTGSLHLIDGGLVAGR